MALALPPLNGSPKQIAWANDLRDETIADSDVALDDPEVVALIGKETSCRYWIDNRMPMSGHVARHRPPTLVYVPPDRGPRVTETDRWTETWWATVEDHTLVEDHVRRVYKRADDLVVVHETSQPRFGAKLIRHSVTVSRDGKRIGARHFTDIVWRGHGFDVETFVRYILNGTPPHCVGLSW